MDGLRQLRVIDRELFLPLSEFLAHDYYHPEEFEGVVLPKYPDYYQFLRRIKRERELMGRVFGGTISQYFLGLVIEDYVKWALSRYAETKDSFSPSRLLDRLKLNEVGNVQVQYPRGIVGDLDAVYEFHNGLLITPVIFEITVMKDKDRPIGVRHKREFIQELYFDVSLIPYFCKVRTAHEDENRRLYIKKDAYREIIIPFRKNFIDLTETLTSMYDSRR